MKTRLIYLSLYVWLGAGSLSAAWISQGTATFAGGASGTTIPDPDGNGTPIELVSNPITVSGVNPATFSGASVRVRIFGLYHPWSGDLVVLIRQVSTGISATLFSQIGATSSGDAGYAADFLTAIGGFYDFYPGAPVDLWSVAASLGDSDFIPDAAIGLPPTPISYFPSSAGSSAGNNFAALTLANPNGQWELVIIDMAAGPDNLGSPELGSVISWELQIFDPVPEPSTVSLTMAALGALAWRLRRRDKSPAA